MATHPALVGIGGNNIDVVYRVDRVAGQEMKTSILPQKGRRAPVLLVGGVTLNHVGWASVLGASTGLIAKQAKDRYGDILRQAMDRLSVDRSHVSLDGSASDFTLIFVSQDGGRAIYMAPAAITETRPDEIRDIHTEYIAEARILSTEISQLPLSCVVEAVRIAKHAGARVAVDVDLPPSYAIGEGGLGTSAQLNEILTLADIVKPTKEAAMDLFPGKRDALALAKMMVERYGSGTPNKICAITDGQRGCAVASGKEAFTLEAARIGQAADTTGAGDAFLGGFLAGMLKNLAVRDAAMLANAAGAACCEQLGAFPRSRDARARVMEYYASLGGTSL